MTRHLPNWAFTFSAMTTATKQVARRVQADIERISNVAAVSRATGISMTTLRRRLVDGNFTAGQLIEIADALRSEPSDYFTN